MRGLLGKRPEWPGDTYGILDNSYSSSLNISVLCKMVNISTSNECCGRARVRVGEQEPLPIRKHLNKELKEARVGAQAAF